MRLLEDEPTSSFTRITPAILSDKDLKGFDEILDNEGNDDWASAQAEIDYNAKLVFSDDEDSGKTDIKSSRKTRNDEQERNNEEYEHSEDWENKKKVSFFFKCFIIFYNQIGVCLFHSTLF